MEALTKVKKIVDQVMNWLCVIILAIMTVLVTYQVVTRYFFNQPSAISEAMAQYLFVWVVMFGSALVFGERGHLEITTIKDKMPPTVFMIVEIVANITLALFAILVCMYGGYQIAMQQMISVDASLQIPMGYIYMAIPLHGIVMVFYAVYNCLRAVEERKANNRPTADATSGTM